MTKCHECRFWVVTETWDVPLEENPDWDGQCHRHAPRPRESGFVSWPAMPQNGECGEGEPRDGE